LIGRNLSSRGEKLFQIKRFTLDITDSVGYNMYFLNRRVFHPASIIAGISLYDLFVTGNEAVAVGWQSG
jgi:hypothetical protein